MVTAFALQNLTISYARGYCRNSPPILFLGEDLCSPPSRYPTPNMCAQYLGVVDPYAHPFTLAGAIFLEFNLNIIAAARIPTYAPPPSFEVERPA